MLVEGGTIRTRINWTGILAGLVVGVVTQLALTGLGVAIGAATIDSTRELAIGTIAWLAVSLAISAWLAGLTASRAAGYLTPAQGRFNGLLTGMLLALGLTLFSYNALLGGVRTALGLAQNVTNAASATANAAANSGAGQNVAQGPLQSVLNGLDEQEIGQIIGENSPELSTEQATAAARVVSGIVRRASNDIGDNLSNISNLDDLVSNRIEAIQGALQGEQFVSRLTAQGLSESEARATATAVSEQVTTLRQQAERTAEVAATTARRAASTAAWSWLLAAGVILLLSTLGGGQGSDVPPTGATTREKDETRRQRA